MNKSINSLICLDKKGMAEVLKDYEDVKSGKVGELISKIFLKNSSPRRIEFRYHEKFQFLRAGQVCCCCGTFYFLDEDENIQETGICESCQHGLDREQLNHQEPDLDFLMEQKRDKEGQCR